MITSEVARLRERLEAEHRACMWALQGLSSGSAQHRFITARFRRMDVCCARLGELVGEEEATTTLCEIFDGIYTPQTDEHRSKMDKEGRS
jgi:hypothetical protein